MYISNFMHLQVVCVPSFAKYGEITKKCFRSKKRPSFLGFFFYVLSLLQKSTNKGFSRLNTVSNKTCRFKKVNIKHCFEVL